jgi:hypothetical protein
MKILNAFTILICFSSCSKDKSTNLPTSSIPRFNPTIQTIIQTNCISCHDATSTVPMHDFNSIHLLALSGQLLGSLTDTSGQYLHMPVGGNLTEQKINEIKIWIENDCPN